MTIKESNNLPMIYRQFTEKDLSILQYWFEDEETYHRLNGILPLKTFWQRVSKLKNQKRYVFSDDELVVGVVTIELENHNKTNIDIIVSPSHRNMGYGIKIIGIVLTLCATQNVFAYIEQDNIAAIRLFEKCKFRFVKKDKDGMLEYKRVV